MPYGFKVTPVIPRCISSNDIPCSAHNPFTSVSVKPTYSAICLGLTMVCSLTSRNSQSHSSIMMINCSLVWTLIFANTAGNEISVLRIHSGYSFLRAAAFTVICRKHCYSHCLPKSPRSAETDQWPVFSDMAIRIFYKFCFVHIQFIIGRSPKLIISRV